MTISGKNKNILLLGGYILLLLVFFYGSKIYFMDNMLKIKNETISYKKELHNLETKNNQIGGLREEYDILSKGFEEISKSVADQNRVVSVIEKLEETAADCRVKIKIQALEEGVKSSDYVVNKKFDIMVGGDFVSVMSFLYHLENFEYYLAVDSIQFSVGNLDDHNQKLVLLKTQITVYQKQNDNI